MAAIVGQVVFMLAIVSLHGSAVVQGDLATLTKAMSPGFLMGATKSDYIVAEYVFLAVIGALAGIAQLMPRVQNSPAYSQMAQRLFVMTNGVWLFQLGLFLTMLHAGTTLSFTTKTLQGPFLTALSFAQYLVPLAIVELYSFARDEGTAASRLAMAAGLVLLTDAMAVGIFQLAQYVSF
jgi:hypothetical protein